MKLLWIFTFVCTVFALGWFSGRVGGGDSAPLQKEKTTLVDPELPAAASNGRTVVVKDISDILNRFRDPLTRLATSLELLDWIDRSDEAAMRAILDQIAENEENVLLTFLLLTCFGEQSPAAAIDWCSGLDGIDEDLAWEFHAIAYLAWYSSDPAAAIAAVETDFEDEKRTELRGMFDSYSAADQVGGTLLDAIKRKMTLESFVQKALLAGRDHGEILREAMGSEGLEPGVREKVIEHVFRQSRGIGMNELRDIWAQLEDEEELQAVAAKAIPWGQFQPLDAVMFGIELGVPKDKIRYREAMRFQPEETIAFIAKLESKEQLDDVYSTLFYGASGGGDRSAWLKLFTELPPDKRPDWGKFDTYTLMSGREKPQQTLGWLKEFDQDDLSEEEGRKAVGGMAEAVGRELGAEDMESLMRKIDAFPEGVIRDHLIAGAIAKLAPQDFNRALDLASGLEGDLLVRMQSELWQDLFKRDGTEAGIGSLDAIADIAQRQDLAKRLVERGEGIPPEGRAALIDRFFADTEDPLRGASSLNEAWMRSDPEAAAAWALKYSDSAGFAHIVERLGSQWWYQDSQATTEYVLALEPGEARDEGLQHVASQIRQVDPHEALELSLGFSDTKRRHQHLLNSLKSIDAHAISPDEALEALRQLDLPESEKAKLKDELDSP